jgi:hypothetical protein
MTVLRLVIFAIAFVGALFIFASYKKRSYLDTQLLSNHAKFVIGFFLVFIGICAALAAYVKGVL